MNVALHIKYYGEHIALNLSSRIIGYHTPKYHRRLRYLNRRFNPFNIFVTTGSYKPHLKLSARSKYFSSKIQALVVALHRQGYLYKGIVNCIKWQNVSDKESILKAQHFYCSRK